MYSFCVFFLGVDFQKILFMGFFSFQSSDTSHSLEKFKNNKNPLILRQHQLHGWDSILGEGGKEFLSFFYEEERRITSGILKS